MTTDLKAKTPIETAYFASNGGELTCSTHGGMYLTSELACRPKAKRISTPLAVWERLNSLEVETFMTEFGYCCETCNAQAKRKIGA